MQRCADYDGILHGWLYSMLLNSENRRGGPYACIPRQVGEAVMQRRISRCEDTMHDTKDLLRINLPAVVGHRRAAANECTGRRIVS